MSSSDTGNVLGIFAILVSIGGVIYTAVNHKRFRLRCCGKDLDVSVDVEDTSTKQTTKQTKPKTPYPQDMNAIGNEKEKENETEKETEEEEEEEEEDREDEEDKQDNKFNMRSNSPGSINGANKTPFKERVAKEREKDRERRVSLSQQQVSLRDQNIEERERSEVLKANYALRVAEARRYNSNQRRIAPLPPLPPLPDP